MTKLATLIEEKLPEDLWEKAKDFDIPEEFLKSDPELMEMVLRSRSIDTDKEKQNWFNLLPVMNDGQMKKLREILDKEKRKLQEIEEKYQKKKEKIKEKYLNKREKEGYIKRMGELEEKEEQAEKQDEKEAEELLSSL